MRVEVKRCAWSLLLSGLVFGVGRVAAMPPESGAAAGAFYGVVRSGRSKQLKDPTLMIPQ